MKVSGFLRENLFASFFCIGLLFVVVTPFFVSHHFYQPTLISHLLFLVLIDLLVALFAIVYFQKNFSGFWKSPVLLLFCLFLCSLVIPSFFGSDLIFSFFGSADRFGGLFLQFHITLFLIMSCWAVFVWKEDFLFKFVFVLLCVAAFSSIFGVFEYFEVVSSFNSAYLPRASSFFGNPAYFSSFLIVPFFLSLWCLFFFKRWQFGILTVLVGSGLFVSGTRSAILGVLLGVVVGVLMYFFKNKKNSSKRMLGVLLSVGVSVIGTVSLLFLFGSNNKIVERLLDFGNNTVSSRLHYWAEGFLGFFERPIFGTGFDSFYRISDKYFTSDLYLYTNSWADRPHNNLIDILVSGGVISFLIYVLFIYVLLKTLSRNELSEWLIAALIAHSVNLFFLFDTLSSSISLVVLVAFAMLKHEGKCDSSTRKRGYVFSLASLLVFFFLMSWLYVPFFGSMISLKAVNNALLTGDQDAIELAVDLEEHTDQNFLLGARYVPEMQVDVLESFVRFGVSYSDLEELFVSAEGSLKKLTQRHKDHARYWDTFMFYYVIRGSSAVFSGEEGYSVIGSDVLFCSDTFHNLSPGRTEHLERLAYLNYLNNDIEHSVILTEEILAKDPENKSAQERLAQYKQLLFFQDQSNFEEKSK